MEQNKKFRYIFMGCLLIAVAIILFTFFGKKKGDDKYVDLAIKAYQQTVDMAKEQRPIFEKQIQDLKDELIAHRKTDSLLVSQINSNKQTLKQVDDRIKNIPDHIAAISGNKDSLRRAFAE